MPFGYFGAKHGMARFYPPPMYRTVVEPFAGTAGYTCYWARQGLVDHAILIDHHAGLIAQWHRLQVMTPDDVMAIECPPKGTKFLEPLIGSASGRQGMAMIMGKPQSVTDRMQHQWPSMRRRIALTVPYIGSWNITQGDYTTAPNIIATWFVDPPYKPRLGDGKRVSRGTNYTAGGFDYREHGGEFTGDYDELAAWCRSRRGQVIVCEQMPANWLPFREFRRQRNGVGAGTQSTRTEAVWIRHIVDIDAAPQTAGVRAT